MSARSEHLSEEAGLLVCYGKHYKERDEDCSTCELNGDCETLTELRRAQQRPARVAKIPTGPTEEDDYDDELEDEDEDENDPWVIPRPSRGVKRKEAPQWAQPQPTEVPPQWCGPQYAHPQYMVPVPPQPMQPYTQPGMHSTANIVPHPAPHLTYMMSNPIDCPMPMVDERWYSRVAKNVASGVLSEGGRQFYEFFRRFRF